MSQLLEKARPYTLKELEVLGFSRMRLSRMVRSGQAENPARGIYRFPDQDDAEINYAWAAITRQVPTALFCLYSAAVHHGMSEDLGMTRYVALPAGERRRNRQGVRFLSWGADREMEAGVDVILVDGVEVRVTSPDRTLVDMFRYSDQCLSDRRRKRIVGADAMADCLRRYLSKYGPPGRKAFLVAKALGIQEEFGAYVRTVQAANPDLWADASRT